MASPSLPTPSPAQPQGPRVIPHVIHGVSPAPDATKDGETLVRAAGLSTSAWLTIDNVDHIAVFKASPAPHVERPTSTVSPAHPDVAQACHAIHTNMRGHDKAAWSRFASSCSHLLSPGHMRRAHASSPMIGNIAAIMESCAADMQMSAQDKQHIAAAGYRAVATASVQRTLDVMRMTNCTSVREAIQVATRAHDAKGAHLAYSIAISMTNADGVAAMLQASRSVLAETAWHITDRFGTPPTPTHGVMAAALMLRHHMRPDLLPDQPPGGLLVRFCKRTATPATNGSIQIAPTDGPWANTHQTTPSGAGPPQASHQWRPWIDPADAPKQAEQMLWMGHLGDAILLDTDARLLGMAMGLGCAPDVGSIAITPTTAVSYYTPATRSRIAARAASEPLVLDAMRDTGMSVNEADRVTASVMDESRDAAYMTYAQANPTPADSSRAFASSARSTNDAYLHIRSVVEKTTGANPWFRGGVTQQQDVDRWIGDSPETGPWTGFSVGTLFGVREYVVTTPNAMSADTRILAASAIRGIWRNQGRTVSQPPSPWHDPDDLPGPEVVQRLERALASRGRQVPVQYHDGFS